MSFFGPPRMSHKVLAAMDFSWLARCVTVQSVWKSLRLAGNETDGIVESFHDDVHLAVISVDIQRSCAA